MKQYRTLWLMAVLILAAISQRPAGARILQMQRQQPTATVIPRTPPAGKMKVNAKDRLAYIWIPAGTFTMGCSSGDNECFEDEKPAHEVTITKGFWMGRHW
jgi:formylglycine-generating enzyme required for sulfatase activity